MNKTQYKVTTESHTKSVREPDYDNSPSDIEQVKRMDALRDAVFAYVISLGVLLWLGMTALVFGVTVWQWFWRAAVLLPVLVALFPPARLLHYRLTAYGRYSSITGLKFKKERERFSRGLHQEEHRSALFALAADAEITEAKRLIAQRTAVREQEEEQDYARFLSRINQGQPASRRFWTEGPDRPQLPSGRYVTRSIWEGFVKRAEADGVLQKGTNGRAHRALLHNNSPAD